MARPDIPKTESSLRAQKKGYASGRASPNLPGKVKKSVQEPKKPKMERFPEFPNEIQQMIWCEAMQKPACHTFKFVQTKTVNTTTMDVGITPSFRDTSPWRYWKSLLYCRRYKQEPYETPKKKKTQKEGAEKPKAENPEAQKPKAQKPKLDGPDLEKFNKEKKNLQPLSKSRAKKNPPKPDVEKSHEAFSKLANDSFQAGFRRSMLQFGGLITAEKGKQETARIDFATDLVILELNRGENACPNSWFEHNGLGKLEIHEIRAKTRNLKRVAVHYKRAHANANKRGPFQCWCANPATLECHRFKACPMEQACFLDCFANLEEFYHVVEITVKDAAAWLEDYRRLARMSNYNLRTWPVPDEEGSEGPEGPRIPLAHFYDEEYEYIQLPAPHKFEHIAQWDIELPFNAHQESRDCIAHVRDIYKGVTGKKDFNTPLRQRKWAKFGVLFAIERDDIERET